MASLAMCSDFMECIIIEGLNDNAALDWGPVNNKNLEDFATDYNLLLSIQAVKNLLCVKWAFIFAIITHNLLLYNRLPLFHEFHRSLFELSFCP